MKISILVAALLLVAQPAPAQAGAADGWAAQALDSGFAAFAARDYAGARTQFTRLANHGSAIGETMLGTLYARGLGVDPDPATAASYWFRAAHRGYAPAQLALARALANGAGVAADPGSAWVWARLAAIHGDRGIAQGAAALAAGLAPGFSADERARLARRVEQWRPWPDGGR